MVAYTQQAGGWTSEVRGPSVSAEDPLSGCLHMERGAEGSLGILYKVTGSLCRAPSQD